MYSVFLTDLWENFISQIFNFRVAELKKTDEILWQIILKVNLGLTLYINQFHKKSNLAKLQ